MCINYIYLLFVFYKYGRGIKIYSLPTYTTYDLSFRESREQKQTKAPKERQVYQSLQFLPLLQSSICVATHSSTLLRVVFCSDRVLFFHSSRDLSFLASTYLSIFLPFLLSVLYTPDPLNAAVSLAMGLVAAKHGTGTWGNLTRMCCSNSSWFLTVEPPITLPDPNPAWVYCIKCMDQFKFNWHWRIGLCVYVGGGGGGGGGFIWCCWGKFGGSVILGARGSSQFCQ